MSRVSRTLQAFLVLGSVFVTGCNLGQTQPAEKISLRAPATEGYVGKPMQLSVVSEPKGSIVKGLSWSSSDASIATVTDRGLVLAEKAGSVTIRAKADGGLSASIRLGFAIAQVRDLEIHEGNRTLLVGDSFTFHVDCAPYYAIPRSLVWSSGNPGVAAVDEETGVVTAVSQGSTILTANGDGHEDTVVVSCLDRIPTVLPEIPQETFPAHSWTLGEREAVPPPEEVPEARVLTERWIELYLPEVPFTAASVGDQSMYTISSEDDPHYSSPMNPVRVLHRYFPERAPFTPPAGMAEGDSAQSGYIVVVYRIFLKVPVGYPLLSGKHYTVTVDSRAVPSLGSLDAAFSGAGAKEVIHVNQEAYPPSGPKLGYLSEWLGPGGVGVDGCIDFSAYTDFSLVDAETKAAVFHGNIERTSNSGEEYYSGSDVYVLDFSSFTDPGRYRIHVPGVGYSSAFSIGQSGFDYVIYTVMRSMTQSRDGNHGLDDSSVTRWNRPPAHLDDAIEQSTGERVDLVGGHMDAGDREKIPMSMALAASTLLSGMKLFPDRVRALDESLQIPESGNGIPDYLDELFFELDCVYRMVANTHQDGAMTAWVKPSNDGYEGGVPPEGATGRIWFDSKYGRLKSYTLAVSGALAMAANDPLVREYSPLRAQAYLGASIKAWNAFATHEFDDSWWSSDLNLTSGSMVVGKHTWSTELVFAASNLLEATGDTKYLEYLNAEWPSSLYEFGGDVAGFILQDYLCVSRNPYVPESMRNQAATWIVDLAELFDAQPRGHTVFGICFPEAAESAVGWFFSGLRTGLPNLIAWGISGDSKYRDRVALCWNYLLGANPLGISHITGLGEPETRVRWLVHEIWDYRWKEHVAGGAGWVEPPPGLVEGDIQNGEYNWWFNSAWNLSRVTKMEPRLGNVPVLYRHIDGWVVYNEAGFYTAAAMAAISLPFVR